MNQEALRVTILAARPAAGKPVLRPLCVGLALALAVLQASPAFADGLRFAPSSSQQEGGPLLTNAAWRIDPPASKAGASPNVIPAQVMGGMPMAMVMPGETLFEMSVGACAAGVVVGIVASIGATPAGGAMVLTNAGVGCGIGILATVAAMGGMSAARAIAGEPAHKH